jgi:hypothetical protein
MPRELAALNWLKAHTKHRGRACLIWPFGRTPEGRGVVGVGNKRVRKAHRVMCELVHGPASTPQHHAAHECGKGHLACVHPRHVFWKTPVENGQDMVRHGNVRKKGTPRYKLTIRQVRRIRALRGKKTQVEIAAMFGVKDRAIGRIQLGQRWAGVL